LATGKFCLPSAAERFSAHHIGSAGRIEPVRRVGLAALELQHDQRSGKTFDVVAHPLVEAQLIEPVPLLDWFGARKLLVSPDAVGHDDAPSYSWERLRGCSALPRCVINPHGEEAPCAVSNHEAPILASSFETLAHASSSG
jgi:hypothetical protein